VQKGFPKKTKEHRKSLSFHTHTEVFFTQRLNTSGSSFLFQFQAVLPPFSLSCETLPREVTEKVAPDTFCVLSSEGLPIRIQRALSRTTNAAMGYRKKRERENAMSMFQQQGALWEYKVVAITMFQPEVGIFAET
jgi:predicted nucleic acid-binding Zn ribbon protein